MAWKEFTAEKSGRLGDATLPALTGEKTLTRRGDRAVRQCQLVMTRISGSVTCALVGSDLRADRQYTLVLNPPTGVWTFSYDRGAV